MTSYSFGLSASWWLVALCGIAAAALSFYAYRVTTPPISTSRKVVLTLLRLFALWILLFALFEPIVNIVRASEEQPRVAVLLDNSQSAGIKDASQDRRQAYRAALDALQPASINGSGDSASILLFDADVRLAERFATDSLKLDGQFTNIAKALQTLFESTESAERTNTRAVLLMTDGAFNAGENPLYAAEMLARPLYIVGIGDSTEPKDMSIQAIITNEIGYVGSSLPVNVNVQTAGFSGGEAMVTLRDGGEVIGEQKIRLQSPSNNASERQTITCVFEYKPKQEGVRKLTAEIKNSSGINSAGVEEELTLRNNTASEFVNVLKNKRKVVMVAGLPTPDISFIRTALTENHTIECTAFVESKTGEFLSDAGNPSGSAGNTLSQAQLTQQLAEAEAIVLVGFPAVSTPIGVVEAIKTEAGRGKPLLFVASKDIDYAKLRVLEPYLPFVTVSVGKQELMVLPDVKQQALSNPVMKLSGTDADTKLWNSLPPLFRTETFIKVKPEAEVLASMRVNNVALNEPLIVQRTLNNTKSLAVLGYGLYRWKLLGFAAETAKGRSEVPDIFATFLENSLRWLTTSDQGKFVRIKTTRQLYGNGEKVEITGQVYDKSYNPLDNADVRVTISGTGIKQPREVPLAALGGGRYAAQVEGLPQGEYSFIGLAALNNQPYGEDKGRFSIGELNIEYQNLRMNAAFLRRLAERTGGKFYTAEEAARNPNKILRDIRTTPTFKARPITQRNEFALWNLPWLLAAALALFSVEWFMRKRSGMV